MVRGLAKLQLILKRACAVTLWGNLIISRTAEFWLAAFSFLENDFNLGDGDLREFPLPMFPHLERDRKEPWKDLNGGRGWSKGLRGFFAGEPQCRTVSKTLEALLRPGNPVFPSSMLGTQP